MSLYNIVYIICNVFSTYYIFKFFRIFYSSDDVRNNKLELFLYVLYFVSITMTFLFVDIPIVMLIINITSFFIISFSYNSNMFKRLFSSLLIYLVLMTVETLVAVLSGYVGDSVFNENHYTLVFGIVASKILSYVMILIINKFKNLNNGISVHKLQWIMILLVPVCTLYLLVLILNAIGYSNTLKLSAVLIVLLLNFIILWLYDYIMKSIKNDYETLILLEKNQNYENQLKTIRDSVTQTQTFRHDMTNHLIVLKELANTEKSENIQHYISKLLDDSTVAHSKFLTGDAAIDSLLNYKIDVAFHKKIRIDIGVQIPPEIKLPSYEMVIILGNILDNAITAVETMAVDTIEDNSISISINYSKGRIIIKEQNKFVTIPKSSGHKFFPTSKRDKTNHGFGLKSIEMQVNKLNGIMGIHTENNNFCISIIIYI